jgi:ribosomal protein L7Ae-like RNA K-turn-binding protein
MNSRCLDLIGLARRSGAAVAGFEKVRAALAAGDVALLVAASDGADDGREKLARRARHGD